MEKVANIVHEVLLIWGFSTVVKKNKTCLSVFLLLHLKADPTAREEDKICLGLMETFFWLTENGILVFFGKLARDAWLAVKQWLDKLSKIEKPPGYGNENECCSWVFPELWAELYTFWPIFTVTDSISLGKKFVLAEWIMRILVTVFFCCGSSYVTCSRIWWLLSGL